MRSGKHGWAGPCWRLELLFGIEAAIPMESVVNAVVFSAAPELLQAREPQCCQEPNGNNPHGLGSHWQTQLTGTWWEVEGQLPVFMLQPLIWLVVGSVLAPELLVCSCGHCPCIPDEPSRLLTASGPAVSKSLWGDNTSGRHLLSSLSCGRHGQGERGKTGAWGVK